MPIPPIPLPKNFTRSIFRYVITYRQQTFELINLLGSRSFSVGVSIKPEWDNQLIFICRNKISCSCVIENRNPNLSRKATHNSNGSEEK